MHRKKSRTLTYAKSRLLPNSYLDDHINALLIPVGGKKRYKLSSKLKRLSSRIDFITKPSLNWDEGNAVLACTAISPKY